LSRSGDQFCGAVSSEDGTRSAGRTELKYCVPAPVSECVLDAARTFLVPDVLALGRASVYVSLSRHPQLTFLRWHRERAGDRFKLRIRHYGEQPAPMLYAELKRKTDQSSGSAGHFQRKPSTPFSKARCVPMARPRRMTQRT